MLFLMYYFIIPLDVVLMNSMNQSIVGAGLLTMGGPETVLLQVELVSVVPEEPHEVFPKNQLPEGMKE